MTFRAMCLALALAVLTALPGRAAEVTLRLAHLNPADPAESATGTMAAVFERLVERGSGGAIDVRLYPGGQLGRDAEVIGLVREGLVESTIATAGGLAQHYPPVGAFDLPFAYRDMRVASRVLRLSSRVGRDFAARLERATGLRTLGLLDSGGFYAITNARRPVRRLEDMAGLRIRTMTLPTHEAIVAALGARPTPLPWAELYTALETGVADGQMNPVPVIALSRLHEVQAHMTLTRTLVTPYIWVVNAAFLDDLSEEHRDLVTSAAMVASEAGRAANRRIEASPELRGMLSEDMAITVLAEGESRRFAEAARAAAEAAIAAHFGAEGAALVESLAASIRRAEAAVDATGR